MVGVVFALVGITGSILTFYPELERVFHPETQVSQPGQAFLIDPIFQRLKVEAPTPNGAWRIELPSAPTAPVTARYYTPAETGQKRFAPLIVTVNPYDLSVTRKRFWGDDVFTWIYDLHYTLQFGNTGKTFLGTVAVFLLALMLSGLYLWWPHRGHWRQALCFRAKAVWKRRIYDLHVKTGVYAFAFLFTLTATGLLLVMPSWFKPTITALSPLTPYYSVKGQALSDEATLSADQAITIAQREFPLATVRWVHAPGPEQAIWRVQLRQVDEPNQRFPRTNVWVNAQTGAIQAIRDPNNNTAADTFMDWLHPLHNGEAFGLIGRIVVCLIGLLPIFALITGITRWRHKTAARTAASPQGDTK